MGPYLPDIMEQVVGRVNNTFSTRLTDPFEVFFDKGIYSQVAKKVYSEEGANTPLIWLIMNYSEDMGDFRYFSDVTCDMSISATTEASYTQQQRDDLIFKPRLLLIYDEFIKQIKAGGDFLIMGDVRHTRIIRPYWGGGLVGGPDTKNLFDQLYVDEIYIKGLRLKVKRQSICVEQLITS